jgi:hypothetical protein
MEKLVIHYGIQGNGMKFGLTVRNFKIIKELFPDAQPAKGVFVEYDMRTNFAQYHPHLERYVFPALLGLANEADLKKIKHIEFVKTPEMIVTHTIDQTTPSEIYEQEVQSVSR